MKLFEKNWQIVSMKKQKDISYTLYLYAEQINNVTYVKFGEAFKQSVWDRYNKTGDTQHSKQIAVWKSEIRDTYIHIQLKKLFKWAGKKDENPLNTNEAYIVESDEEIQHIIDTISNIVENQSIGPDFYRLRYSEKAYTPRLYQFQVIEKAKEKLQDMERILINLSTRAGKSYVSLKICKDMHAKNILILTPFPSAEDSFEHLADYNEEFTGYKYIHLNANTKTTDFCDKNIIFCSYQYYNDNKKNIEFIKQLKFDFIVIDECHNTSDSERTKKILENLKYKKIIYMSGTPFNDIYSGYFQKDEVITFDFIDFIKFAKKHPDQVKLPNLHVKNVGNIAEIQDHLIDAYPDIFKEADCFDYSTIFSDEQHAEAFFKWLLQPVESNSLIIKKKRWFNLSDQKRILAFFNRVSEVEVAKKALKKILPDYKIVSISGEDVDLNSTDEATINEVFEEEKTIILTCAKLTTGVTLPKLDTVWLFKNTSSAEQFIQILFRCMTPCKGKTDVSMYCFNSELSLSVIKEYATVRLDEKSTNVTKQDNDTFKSVLDEILRCINFTYLNDNFKWTDESPEVLYEKLHNLPYSHTVCSVFSNFSSFNGIKDLHTEELKEEDLKVNTPQGKVNKGQCDFNEELKEYLSGKKFQKGNNGKKDSCMVVRQLLKLLLNFDIKIFIDDSIKVYTDLEKLIPEELKDYEDRYRQLLDDNKIRINQMIEDIRYKKLHNQEDCIGGLSRTSKYDIGTPDNLCNLLWNKVSNPSLPVLDPCGGKGNILRYGVKHFGIKPEDCWTVEINPDNVEILKLQGFNVYCGDITDEKLVSRMKEDMKKKYGVNILNMNVIGNPPFYYPKPEGMKRTAAHLDIIIWKKILEYFPESQVVFIMSYTCNQMKNKGYTSISEIMPFSGAGILVCIFERKPGEKPVKIIKKYEANGKLDWLKEHDKTRECNHTLWHLINRGKLLKNYLDVVPEGYIAFHDRSGSHIDCWLPGEQTLLKKGKLSKTNCYVKTSNPEKMIEFFDTVVSPAYSVFIKKFGDCHVDRGFTKVIIVPEELL